jgi:hypothetical protein
MSVSAPRPDAASNPHDAYTQSVFRELPQARGFFRGYLPDEVQELFDWRTLRLETGNFLSDELQRDFADLRFSIRFAGGQRAHRITLLFEHKHRVIYTTPRQLHRYISRQLEETPDGQPLPSILTVVLLQSGTWNRSRTLSSEYDLPEPARGILAPYLVDFRMVMVELGSLDEGELKGTQAERLALAMLKTVGEEHPMGWLRFRSILRDVCREFPPERLRRELRRALYYLLSVTEENQEAEVRQALQSIQDEFLPVKENIMTLLEHLQKTSEKRGQFLGKAHTLIRQLSAVFAEFTPAHADRVRQLPDELLDDLTDAIAMHRTWAEIEPILRHPDEE